MSTSETVDVPLLLAPEPFIGAYLHQHIPHVCLTSLHNLTEAYLLPPGSESHPSLSVLSASVTFSSIAGRKHAGLRVNMSLMSPVASGNRLHG